MLITKEANWRQLKTVHVKLKYLSKTTLSKFYRSYEILWTILATGVFSKYERGENMMARIISLYMFMRIGDLNTKK